ncbi:MAG: helix-turn-helix transcriptional regulator [Brevibacterium aurantiacum]|uniref:helix-turn-helix transcriptional regulator n=1 Tax=Brevibacterium aurantiacum TaxID=273384 RepID=UPI003F937F82
MTTERIDRLLFIEEVADKIRRSPSAVRYLVHVGDAPKSAKIGGRRMFKESDVNAWIEEQFNKAAS